MCGREAYIQYEATPAEMTQDHTLSAIFLIEHVISVI